MKKQLHIKINDLEPVVIDVIEDESVNISLDQPPTKFQKEKDRIPKTLLKIDGLRWRDNEHYHLGWLEREVVLNDAITIQLKEDNRVPTPLAKEELYEKPEKECSFCHRKASEVKHLVEKDMFNRICDECVKSCQKAIDARKAT